MIIPFEKLEKDTLVAIIKDWLSRQSQEGSFELSSESENIERVLAKLAKSEFFVTWNNELETMNIIDAQNAATHESDTLASEPFSHTGREVPVDYDSGDQSPIDDFYPDE